MERSHKKEIIKFLNENNSSPFIRNVVDLCNILIEEAREANDEAHGDAIYVNQGQIKALKALVVSITKKIPEELKSQMVIDS